MTLKKQWYEIVAPEMFNSVVVGETPAADAKQLIGRMIEVSMVDIVQDFQRFFVKLRLRIVRVENGKAYTQLVGHRVIGERIYRMVQRRGRRVDVVQDITTKDGARLRIKTVFMLNRRVGTSLKDAARAAVRRFVGEFAPGQNFEDLMGMIIDGAVQRDIKKVASKIYPTGNAEIRATEVLPVRAAAT